MLVIPLLIWFLKNSHTSLLPVKAFLFFWLVFLLLVDAKHFVTINDLLFATRGEILPWDVDMHEEGPGCLDSICWYVFNRQEILPSTLNDQDIIIKYPVWLEFSHSLLEKWMDQKFEWFCFLLFQCFIFSTNWQCRRPLTGLKAKEPQVLWRAGQAREIREDYLEGMKWVLDFRRNEGCGKGGWAGEKDECVLCSICSLKNFIQKEETRFS